MTELDSEQQVSAEDTPLKRRGFLRRFFRNRSGEGQSSAEENYIQLLRRAEVLADQLRENPSPEQRQQALKEFTQLIKEFKFDKPQEIFSDSFKFIAIAAELIDQRRVSHGDILSYYTIVKGLGLFKLTGDRLQRTMGILQKFWKLMVNRPDIKVDPKTGREYYTQPEIVNPGLNSWTANFSTIYRIPWLKGTNTEHDLKIRELKKRQVSDEELSLEEMQTLEEEKELELEIARFKAADQKRIIFGTVFEKFLAMKNRDPEANNFVRLVDRDQYSVVVDFGIYKRKVIFDADLLQVGKRDEFIAFMESQTMHLSDGNPDVEQRHYREINEVRRKIIAFQVELDLVNEELQDLERNSGKVPPTNTVSPDNALGDTFALVRKKQALQKALEMADEALGDLFEGFVNFDIEEYKDRLQSAKTGSEKVTNLELVEDYFNSADLAVAMVHQFDALDIEIVHESPYLTVFGNGIQERLIFGLDDAGVITRFASNYSHIFCDGAPGQLEDIACFDTATQLALNFAKEQAELSYQSKAKRKATPLAQPERLPALDPEQVTGRIFSFDLLLKEDKRFRFDRGYIPGARDRVDGIYKYYKEKFGIQIQIQILLQLAYMLTVGANHSQYVEENEGNLYPALTVLASELPTAIRQQDSSKRELLLACLAIPDISRQAIKKGYGGPIAAMYTMARGLRNAVIPAGNTFSRLITEICNNSTLASEIIPSKKPEKTGEVKKNRKTQVREFVSAANTNQEDVFGANQVSLDDDTDQINTTIYATKKSRFGRELLTAEPRMVEEVFVANLKAILNFLEAGIEQPQTEATMAQAA